MPPIKVIIAGGRDFTDYNLLKRNCDHILSRRHPDVIIVSGKARGADSLGERYAKERGYLVHEFPADWNRFGKKAGYLRNSEMARHADALIAFWDNNSRGTKHMIDLAIQHNLKVIVVPY